MSKDKKPKAGIWALCGKFGGKFISLLLKTFKLSKVGLAAISFASYAAIYSWKFALLLMVAVGFHESGHVWAMKKMGIKTKGFYFLPFVGGAAIAEENYKTYGENAYIAIMGPIWGMMMSFVAMMLYWLTGNPLWASAGGWMAVINLFNLLPVSPLDGGQLMRCIAFSIHKTVGVIFLFASMILAGLILWKLHIGLFVLLLIVGGVELFTEIRIRIKLHQFKLGMIKRWNLPTSVFDNDANIKYYPDNMNAKQLTLTAVSYVGTIIGLLIILFLLKKVQGADLAANFLQ